MTSYRSSSITKHRYVISNVGSGTSLKQLKQIHAQLLINGHLKDPNILGQFVAAIALKTTQNLRYSARVLDQCKTPNVFALNSMIRAHCKGSTPEKSFHFFNRILWSCNDLSPDNYTFNFLVRAACSPVLARGGAGPAVHAAIVKRGFESDPHVQSGLIRMYAEMGCLDFSIRVFRSIRNPDLVCQTTMVTACAKCGDVGFARELFDLMPQRDSWAFNAMIAGYAQCGHPREALKLFNFMQLEGFKVGEVSLVSVLSACSQLGALEHGRWAHAYIERYCIPITVALGTALVDMYAKCGDMDRGMDVFQAMKAKNVYTWSCAMNGLAMNGAGEKCLELFAVMRKDGVLPNEITYLAVLRACSVIGLVEKGREHFESMRKDYGIEPLVEHYGCMVDLYARAGRFDEALNIIINMPMRPHAGAWGAFLNACKLHKNMELGELCARNLIELEGKNHGAYVMLSNIHADSWNWGRVEDIRQTMQDTAVRKLPGCSAIELDGEVHEFFVGDNTSHPREVDVMLGKTSRELNLINFCASLCAV